MTQQILFAFAFQSGAHLRLAFVYVVLCLLVAGLVKWWTDKE
jgi:hypothetical protein